MRKVFISYSHVDTRWLKRLLVHLRPLERNGQIDRWDDTRIKAGQKWSQEIEAALTESTIAVLLVSADFLASEFIASEELPALLRAAAQNACRVLPVIIGPCLFSEIKDLQQFQAINSPGRPLAKMRKAEAEECLAGVAKTILDHLSADQATSPSKRPVTKTGGGSPSSTRPVSSRRGQTALVHNTQVEGLIRNVKLGDWNSAERAALQVVAATDSAGRNKIFEALLDYQDCSDDDDQFWGALHTAESCVRLAPWLINHEQLSRMAAHRNFSVRSSAASICMELANSAPDRVPLDLLLTLSVHDEDWYVEAPANAALKAMAHSFPAVLQVFYVRLRSSTSEERLHAAQALLGGR
jgi:TIR domain